MQDFLTTHYDLDHPDLVSVIDDLPIWSAPFGLKLLDTIRLKPEMTVLDIGSGLGFPIIELSQRVDHRCLVCGIDPWDEGLRRINRKKQVWDIRNVVMFKGKAEHLPSGDKCIDLIVSNNGINNVQDEGQVFKELKRVARQRAQLVLTVNLPDTMKTFYQTYEQVLKQNEKRDEIDRLKEHIFSKRKPLPLMHVAMDKKFLIRAKGKGWAAPSKPTHIHVNKSLFPDISRFTPVLGMRVCEFSLHFPVPKVVL